MSNEYSQWNGWTIPFRTATKELMADPAYQAATPEEKLFALEAAAKRDSATIKLNWVANTAPAQHDQLDESAANFAPESL